MEPGLGQAPTQQSAYRHSFGQRTAGAFVLSWKGAVSTHLLRPPQVHELYLRYQGEEITVDGDKVNVGIGALW
jgi:hypothetical protein